MKVKAINPLNLGGRPYPAGAILEVPNPLAEKWLAMKYIEKAETEKKSEAVKAEEKPAVRKKTAKRPASKK
jgi:hypothetical protein